MITSSYKWFLQLVLCTVNCTSALDIKMFGPIAFES
jgi:hypothetical protein